MSDHFDEDLKQSLNTQASRVPQTYDLGRSAITRARAIRRRRRVVGSAAAAALVAVAVPVGLHVGDVVSRSERPIAPATGNEGGGDSLTITREDGSTFILGDATVTCGPSEGDPSLTAITVMSGQGPRDRSYFLFEGILRDLPPDTTITLPHSFNYNEPSGAFLFVGANKQIEASSAEQESQGSFVIDIANCDPIPEIVVHIEATLDSEYFDGESVQVQGTLSLRGDPTAEPTTGPDSTATATATAEPSTEPITGPTRIDIDFATLPAADQPPLVPYVEGRTIVNGESRIEVTAEGDIAAAAAFVGGAHVYLNRDSGAQLVRVTGDGTEELGAPAGVPIASPDLRWNAYAIGATDKFGNVERGITLAVFDSSTGSTSTVQLPAANSVRMLALIDGTVYYKPERPDGTPQPLSSWAAGEESPTVVRGSYDATALSWDGRVVAALTEVTDFGSCTQVVDRTSGSALMETCDYSVLGLSPDGSFAWAGPPYLDGYSIGDLAVLDTRTGEVIRRLPSSFDNSFLNATFEDADHLLIRAEQRNQTALVRCTVSTGDCELATPAADGTSAIGGSPYMLAF